MLLKVSALLLVASVLLKVSVLLLVASALLLVASVLLMVSALLSMSVAGKGIWSVFSTCVSVLSL